MPERKIVRTANEDLPVIKEMNAASKICPLLEVYSL